MSTQDLVSMAAWGRALTELREVPLSRGNDFLAVLRVMEGRSAHWVGAAALQVVLER